MLSRLECMRAENRTRPAHLKKLVFTFIPAILVFGTAELLIRWTGAAETCSSPMQSSAWVCDPLLYFRNNPDQIIFGKPLNSAGFRGREFSPKKPGVFRILSLGDSCTFGVAAPENGYFIKFPYPRLLEKMIALKHGPGRAEVLNAGSVGYNSFQGLLLLRTRLRDLDPDLITVRFGWNDHLMSGTRGLHSTFRESPNPIVRSLKDLLLRTALYPFAVRLASGVNTRILPRGTPLLPTRWEPGMSISDYKYALRKIAELGQERGARVWFLTAPQAFTNPKSLARYEALPPKATGRMLLRFNAIESFERMRAIHDRYTLATREVAEALDIPLVDMDAIYSEADDERLFSLEDGLHPTPRGHHLEAQSIYLRLLASGMLANLPSKGR